MNELALLKEYVNTLEAENNAKNNERDTLYQQLQQFMDENYNLASQLHSLQGIRIQHQQQHHIIIQLQQANNFLKCQLDNLIKLLEEKDSLIQNLKYQQQKDTERIINLEDIYKQCRKNQSKQRDHIAELSARINLLQSQISQLQQHIRVLSEKQSKPSLEMTENTNANNDSKINELIENYQKVEQIAYEKNLENQWLRQELAKLQQQISKYKYCINNRDNEIKVLQKKLQNLSHLSSAKNSRINNNQQRREKQHQGTKNSMNLVRQNNRLIERIIQLEKQKNMLYFSAVSVCQNLFSSNCSSKGINSVRKSDGSSNTKSPLKIITSRAINRQAQGQTKIKQKIAELKRENQILMENLRI